MMWFGYPFVPGPYLSSVHLVTFPAFLIFVVGFFIFTSNSNPGRITKENWEMYNSIFPIDNVIYGPGTCRTCQHGKVARSKHCTYTAQTTFLPSSTPQRIKLDANRFALWFSRLHLRTVRIFILPIDSNHPFPRFTFCNSWLQTSLEKKYHKKGYQKGKNESSHASFES